jgi:hypothetical protein
MRAQVTATDADTGLNGQLHYSIGASDRFETWFAIDPATGLITTAASIDCEVSSRPEITVVATDRGHPPLAASTRVVISVLDVNDNAPVFERSIYNVTIREDEDIGKCFVQVSVGHLTGATSVTPPVYASTLSLTVFMHKYCHIFPKFTFCCVPTGVTACGRPHFSAHVCCQCQAICLL